MSETVPTDPEVDVLVVGEQSTKQESAMAYRQLALTYLQRLRIVRHIEPDEPLEASFSSLPDRYDRMHDVQVRSSSAADVMVEVSAGDQTTAYEITPDFNPDQGAQYAAAKNALFDALTQAAGWQ